MGLDPLVWLWGSSVWSVSRCIALYHGRDTMIDTQTSHAFWQGSDDYGGYMVGILSLISGLPTS